ncbi:hypothetical protein O1611_g1454 [Lasiodiplodia mahajangana]|uniref:Uncharacterized protein n=1 Tax=Lasiodiplodia mahajangana TaxID=1108764 RepID=A0ACC2JY83_9PEZI|nr:hypothetical protein O1611_g1454 [Lasiodiplodia mahajangana]
MADGSIEGPTPLALSDKEKRVLELHDKLQQLQLELALLNAQKRYVPVDTTPGRTVEVAQRELLDSRARYMLRNEVVASVVSTNPILQAVHNGTKASPIERDLLPILTDRDAATSALAPQNNEFHSLLSDLTDVEIRALRLEYAAEIARLEAEVKGSRRKWRVLKDTASAIVAGSGVDWARDAELREIVLDPVEEEA